MCTDTFSLYIQYEIWQQGRLILVMKHKITHLGFKNEFVHLILDKRKRTKTHVRFNNFLFHSSPT